MEEEDKPYLFKKYQKRNSDQLRVCPHCNKKLSSGKALGGHMRIHLPVKKFQSATVINGGSNHNPTCSLCGKIFPSMKSLFGHMRCHPEREWRGINPPAGKREYQNSFSDDDHVDLMQSFPCWSVTGRRGRTGTVPVSEPSSSEEDEKFHNAAGELLLLAQIDSIGSNATEKQIGEAEIEDPDCIHRSKKRVIEEDFGRVDETEYSVLNEFSCRDGENTKVKKAKKMKLTIDLASFNRNDSPDKYKCSTCNKSFSTHQALGGHRSSHNKFKISTIDESAVTSQEYHQNNNNSNNGNNPNCVIPPHQCKICKKIFSTGQALGGHKRCHWTGLTESAPSAKAESAGEPSQPSQRVLQFDLNEVPPNDDDEHGAGFDCDYALSSYKSNFLLD